MSLRRGDLQRVRRGHGLVGGFRLSVYRRIELSRVLVLHQRLLHGEPHRGQMLLLEYVESLLLGKLRQDPIGLLGRSSSSVEQHLSRAREFVVIILIILIFFIFFIFFVASSCTIPAEHA